MIKIPSLTLAVSLLLPSLMAVAAADPVKPKPSPLPPAGPQTWEQMRTIELDQEVKELPEPAGLAERRTHFDRRNEPDRIEALAHEFFRLWDTGERHSSREEITRRLDPVKAEIYRLYEEGKHQEALDAFRAYFFAKLRLIYRDRKGFVSRGYEGRFNRDIDKQNYEGNLTLLMKGAHQVAETKETVRIGEPGEVRWNFVREGDRIWSNLRSRELEYFHIDAAPFDRLWWKFTDTKDLSYLERYLAYLDDYVLHQDMQENLSAANLDLGKQGLTDASAWLHGLSEVARWLPPGGDGYPSATLARTLVRMLTLQLPQSLYYNREQSNNHSTGAIQDALHISNYLYDFRFARVLERESKRQFESYGTLFEKADGAMPGKILGYSFHELTENQLFLDGAREYDYDWFTPQWLGQTTDRFLLRAYYVMNLHQADGETVQVYKGDRRNSSLEHNYAKWFTRNLPQLWKLPAMSAIRTRIIHNQLRANWRGEYYMSPARPIAREGQGVAMGAIPPYTSISFPVAGTHVIRSGWDPATDHYGVFAETRGYGDDGGLVHEVKNSNTLQIGAFGQDLLTNGTGYVYEYVESPVQADGLSQFSVNGKGTHARKGESNEGLLPVSPHRIHHSAAFDVAEGFYDGAWAKTIDHDPAFYDWEYRKQIKEEAVAGISHRRVVQFVKEHGIWVVIDVMESDQPRDYTQQFFMAAVSEKQPEGYAQDDFIVDREALTIVSKSPEKPNLTLYFAGPAAAELQLADIVLKEEEVDPYQLFRADRQRDKKFFHLRNSWRAEGRSLLITVLEGTRSGGTDGRIAEFQRHEGGFTAKLTSGGTLQFEARLVPSVAEGFESKLTLVDEKGASSGIALGADNHEFNDLPQGRVPVHRPIRDLVISPAVTAFVDSIDVTVTCADKDVEIRYSLDGVDPTLQSPLYRGPLKLTGPAQFKARAFRQGVEEMPADLTSGTLMSRVFSATLMKQEALPPGEMQVVGAKPGLSYSYYQAKWPFLLFGATSLEPIRRGTVQALFETPTEDHSGPFGFLYEGHLNIPTEGVYTIHAPDEFMKFRPLAGYDLNVSLGHQMKYDKGHARPGGELNQWEPATQRHAFGKWSVALKQGMHPIRVYYADLRPGAHLEYLHFTYPDINIPGLTKNYFDGEVPVLEISGPDLPRQPIPASWLFQ